MPYKDKEIARIKHRELYLKNRYQERYRDKVAAYRIAHADEQKKYMREYYQANKEKHCEQGKIYRASHKEEGRMRQRKYRAANRLNLNAKSRLYRARNRDVFNARMREMRRKEREERALGRMMLAGQAMEAIIKNKAS